MSLSALLAVWVLLGSRAAPQSIQPATPTAESLAVQDELFAVRLLEEGACCPSASTFEVRDRRSGAISQIRLTGRVENVRRLTLVHGRKLLVSGTLPHGGEVHLLADLASGLQLDEIWSYGSRLSPSGRYLAYWSHYPRFVLPLEARRSVALVYDFAKTPAENRAQGTDGGQTTAGLPVFPQENAVRKSHDALLDGPRVPISPLLWSEDEQKLVFIVDKGAEPRSASTLVAVDLGGELAPRVSERGPIPIETFLTPIALRSMTEAELREQRVAFERLEWKGRDSIVAETSPDYRIQSRIELQLPHW